MNETRKPLGKVQVGVLAAAFVPMLATGVVGGIGTYSNIGHAYGTGTALGALGAGEGATAVLALVLLGLTMLGQSSPRVVRIGLWALPAAAAVMGAMAAPDLGRTVIYALTPMGMSVSAEGMAFLARRIVVHTDGRDAENERHTADIVQALAYHRARAAHHPSDRVRKRSDRASWRLARKVGVGDAALGSRLLDVQRDRITDGANAALLSMFGGTDPTPTPVANEEESAETVRNRSMADLRESGPAPSVVLTRFPVPDPVVVDFVKPTLPVKPVPAIAAPVESAGRRAVAVDSPDPVGRPAGFPTLLARLDRSARRISCSLRPVLRPPIGPTAGLRRRASAARSVPRRRMRGCCGTRSSLNVPPTAARSREAADPRRLFRSCRRAVRNPHLPVVSRSGRLGHPPPTPHPWAAAGWSGHRGTGLPAASPGRAVDRVPVPDRACSSGAADDARPVACARSDDARPPPLPRVQPGCRIRHPADARHVRDLRLSR